ncbi:lysoplasmalogenase family protein [Micromonospora sp. CPCC 206061]|uniref:lysoplasmalogenase family protein n=1 Tax=Micromonospora sp. CPCC 206061 TaxID=3122410 RepID=UPI002FEEE802
MSRARQAAVLYAAAGAVDVLAAGARKEQVRWAAKPLLMPLLALYAVAACRERRRRVSRRLLLALALAWAGDVALRFRGTAALATGATLFLAAYGVYAAEFVRRDARGRRAQGRVRWLAPVGYGALTGAVLARLWPGLRATGLAVPLSGYAMLVAAMAAAATTQGGRVAAGAALLLVSDALLGADLAGERAGGPAWVMATYLLGQGLVVSGWPDCHNLPQAGRA